MRDLNLAGAIMKLYYRIGLLALVALTQLQGTWAQGVDRVQEQNGVTFVSGGIGEDSRNDLAAREKSYNFKLITTLEGSGSYVSGVRVTLSTAGGDRLVQHLTDGPIMLASLSAGTYVITASFRGDTLTRKFQVKADRLHTEYLRWAAQPSLDVTLPPEQK
jgi:hypothetical protein